MTDPSGTPARIDDLTNLLRASIAACFFRDTASIEALACSVIITQSAT